MKQKLIWILSLALLVLGACSGDRIYENYQGLESQKWNVIDTIHFELPKHPVGHTILGIKYTHDYKYRNLYVRYILKDSLNQVLESQLLDIPLFESVSGKPLGKGFGSTYTKYDTLPLQNLDYHSVSFTQYMRLDTLPGIEAVGIKLVH
jgi:gliding motility-associated lipoprotein GldH